MSFLSPQFFDFLVLAFTALGLFFAVRRLVHDLRGGPRYQEIGADDRPSESPQTGDTNAGH